MQQPLSRQLADPSNDAIAAMFQEVSTLHHELITQTPVTLHEKRLFALAHTDGELIARSSRILEPYILEIVDSVVPERGAYHLLEVGCGSGVYIRRACLRNPDLQAVGLEPQPKVGDAARKNLQAWGLAERASVETEDIRFMALQNASTWSPFTTTFTIFPSLSDWIFYSTWPLSSTPAASSW